MSYSKIKILKQLVQEQKQNFEKVNSFCSRAVKKFSILLALQAIGHKNWKKTVPIQISISLSRKKKFDNQTTEGHACISPKAILIIACHRNKQALNNHARRIPGHPSPININARTSRTFLKCLPALIQENIKNWVIKWVLNAKSDFSMQGVSLVRLGVRLSAYM